MSFSLINPYYLLLDFNLVFKKFQVWRIITAFLFAGRFSQSFLFTMMMIYFTMKQCEEYFKTKKPEFAVLILFNMLTVTLISYLWGDYMVLNHQFVSSIMYVWCKLQPESVVLIWGYPCQAGMVPWVYVGLNIIMGGDPFKELIGIAAGHLYIYLKVVLPLTKGYNPLKTPRQIVKMVEMIERWANRGQRPSNTYGMGGNWAS